MEAKKVLFKFLQLWCTLHKESGIKGLWRRLCFELDINEVPVKSFVNRLKILIGNTTSVLYTYIHVCVHVCVHTVLHMNAV